MNGGVKASLLVSCLAVAGCVTATKEVKFQAIPDPSAVLSQGGDEIAVARGQFLLGNVGLALEGFRKAQRANPSNPAALAGIGDCYASMGRFDLAQSNYEAALALAPHNHQLLLGLAAIFDREGKPALAMAARAEVAVVPQATAQSLAALAAPTRAVALASTRVPEATPTVRPPRPVPVTPEKLVEIPRPSVDSVTVELPRARPVGHVDSQMHALAAREVQAELPGPVSPAVSTSVVGPVAPMRVAEVVEIPHPSIGSVTVELPSAHPAEHVVALAADLPATEIAVPATVQPSAIQSSVQRVSQQVEQAAAIPRPSLETAMLAVPTPRRTDHVEAHPVQLRPVNIKTEVPVEAEAALPDAPARPALPRKPVPSDTPAVAVALAPAPRLERLTSGEVALVTTGKSLWHSTASVQTASGSTVRWVALASPQGHPNVQILNAARSQGLAASARTVLLDRGWRKIAVGDAPAMLHRSVVLYPKNRAALGHRLAAQFGVGAQVAERDNVVLVLGRDSVVRISSRRGS